MSVFDGHGGHLSFEYCQCVVMAHPPEPLAPPLIKSWLRACSCSDDGQQLQVRQMCTDHNHTILPEAYRHAAVNHALDADSRATAALILDLGANATKVWHHLTQTTQKVVTKHDIQNIQTASKASTSHVLSTWTSEMCSNQHQIEHMDQHTVFR